MKLPNFSDMLFEHDEKPAEPTHAQAAPVASAPMRTAPTTGVTGAVDTNLLSGFVEKLRGKLAQAPGQVTIQQFLTIAESLAEAIPDEGGRFRAALKTLQKTANVTQAQVTDAFSSLLGVIEAERGKFAKVIEGQTANEVTARENSIKGINDQIEQLSKQRDELASGLVEQRTKISAAQISFDGAVQTLTSEVQDSLNKLRIYAPSTSASATTK